MLPDILFLAGIPVAELALANSAFARFGYGEGNLSAKISNKPNNQHTHYGLAMGLTNAQYDEIRGVLDRDERPKGMPASEATAFKKLIHATEPYGMRPVGQAYDEFLAANNLQRLPETDMAAAKA